MTDALPPKIPLGGIPHGYSYFRWTNIDTRTGDVEEGKLFLAYYPMNGFAYIPACRVCGDVVNGVDLCPYCLEAAK